VNYVIITISFITFFFEGLTGTMIDEDMEIYGYRMGKKTKITFPGNDF
jgi:hypothetical protein